MIVSFDTLPADEVFEVCIAGSGPAGLTLAMELARRGQKVLLLEGGAREFDSQWQDLAEGEIVGDPYYEPDVGRLRQFGGTSNHWAGWCRPLDEIDFSEKDYSPLAHWPIQKSDLDPYANLAKEYLDLNGTFTDDQVSSSIRRISFLFSNPPARFGEKFSPEIANSENLVVALECAVVGVRNDRTTVKSFVVSSIDSRRVDVRASKFVFACGGLENVRLCLYFDQFSNNSLMGQAPTLGQYWMEHPHFTIGEVITQTENGGDQYYSLTSERMRELGVLNCGLRVPTRAQRGLLKETIRELSCTAPRLGAWLYSQADRHLICSGVLRAAWEQEPNPESRISLSDDRVDLFGIPTLRLNWRKTSKDIETVRATAIELGEHFARNDQGRIRIDDWVLNGGPWPEADELGGHHHMGGTRMSLSPHTGIVDSNLRVWSKDNLYIAGSSVFPSGGHANPTFTIVQLSLRLADLLS